MTDNQTSRHTPPSPLPPETVNDEQEDETTQAQAVADEAIGRKSTAFGLSDTEKMPTGNPDVDEVPDLIDRMRQMESSGQIDLGAFRGERNDDDEEGMLGEAGEED